MNPVEILDADQHRTNAVARNAFASEKPGIRGAKQKRGYDQGIRKVFQMNIFYRREFGAICLRFAGPGFFNRFDLDADGVPAR